ncbi:hypothetical protein GCM10027447_17780 [Glycomyces halotolerans]
MSALRLAWLELRRFRGRAARVAALPALVLLPCLYGGLYLWSAWSTVERGADLVPIAVAVSLWIFGLAAYLLLRPANPRALAGALRSSQVALGGWAPAAVLGTASALALYAVVDFGLGLEAAYPQAAAGLCVLAALAFSAIAHLCRLAFGAGGTLLVALLLILQSTSAGGLYPVESTPEFFQALHPWMPMTYAVEGLEAAIGGGIVPLVRAAVVLTGCLVGSLVLSTAVVSARRTWSPGRLRPPLRA